MTQTLTPLILGLGVQELVIILVIILLLFGGSRLAGLGKSTGRALKEFKEETKGLSDKDGADVPPPGQAQPGQAQPMQVTDRPAVAPAQTPYPQYPHVETPPNTLADPSPTDVRKDA